MYTEKIRRLGKRVQLVPMEAMNASISCMLLMEAQNGFRITLEVFSAGLESLLAMHEDKQEVQIR